MNPTVQTNRQLVPRWRPLSQTVSSRELASPALRGQSEVDATLPQNLVNALERWRREPNTIHAAELLENALAYGHDSEAVRASRFLVGSASRATPIVRKQAELLLQRTGNGHELPGGAASPIDVQPSQWRARTRLNPRDALAWVELARAQTIKGSRNAALRSIAVALQIAPTNRHVVRSASRLFLHVGDPERAHDVVLRNPATPQDPWLMAAEIALAPSAQRSPRFVKSATAAIDDYSRAPRQISELAAATGTTYLRDGNRKRGKGLFSKSIIDPTGNALAQAQWASRAFGEHLVNEEQVRRSRDGREAMALLDARVGNFSSSLEHARAWIQEEPFSSRAYSFGAGTANTLDDYSTALKLADAGLRHHGHRADGIGDDLLPFAPPRIDVAAVTLLNNKVFALACGGMLDEAERVLKSIPAGDLNDLMRFVGDANAGLIAIRRGQFDRGRELYQAAISGFRRRKAFEYESVARAYFAREAAAANFADAKAIIDEVDDPKILDVLPAVKRTIESAKSLLTARLSSSGAANVEPRLLGRS